MQVYATFNVFGIYLLDHESNILHEVLTYPDVDESVDNVRNLTNAVVTNYLERIAEGIPDDATVVVADSNFGSAFSTIVPVPIESRDNDPVIKWFHTIHDSQLIERGVAKSRETVYLFRREVGLKLARSAVSEASEEKDLSLKHAIDGVDEIDKSINMIAMRLREWYSLHFPLLNDIIEDHEHFASIVRVCGSRTNITKETLDMTIIPDSLKEKILSSSDTLGASMTPADLKVIRLLAESILNLYDQRRALEEYVSTVMNDIAPNITTLVGPLVGAKLIRLAGSLKDLARKPSSTLQILGAEKALFRSLKTGADPPKHGVIYQVAEIHSAPYWQRGKIARALAGKLSIAAKIDAYAESTTKCNLREQFEVRLAEIQRQNPSAPPPKPSRKVTRTPRKTAHLRRSQGGRTGNRRKRKGGR